MTNTDESVTRRECYNRFRKDGFGRVPSVFLGWTLYSITQMEHVEGLIDRDKWRDVSDE